MNEDVKKPFDLGPILPMFGAGVDLGERLGAMDSRLKQLESGQARLEIKIESGDAKLEAKIDALDTKADKMANAIHRLDERIKSLESKFNLSIGLTGAVLAAVVAGFIVQLFSK